MTAPDHGQIDRDADRLRSEAREGMLQLAAVPHIFRPMVRGFYRLAFRYADWLKRLNAEARFYD